MLLAIDIGNTNVALGLFDGEKLDQHWRIGTQTHATSDECAATLRALFDLADIRSDTIRAAVISCVVPSLLPIFERTCTKLFRQEPLIVNPGIRTGMKIRVDHPREVGADRIANSVAAYDLLDGAAISIDFGTATSFDCISADGEFVGGAIVPGVLVSLEGLVASASRISSVEIVRPPSVIGRNTAHCVQSGMLFGYAGLVDALVRRLREELDPDAKVLATGGLAHVIAAEAESIGRIEPFLTLRGLRLIYERNKGEHE